AVNLAWAVERMRRAASAHRALPPPTLKQRLLDEATAIWEEDRERCRAIGENGARFVPAGARILTHCNAGALATAGVGTALAVIFQAATMGRVKRVYVDETRPLLQGARLTAWELSRAKVPATLICDNMSGSLMQRGEVDLVVVGADRIARNGDTANKIGTYMVSVLAREHGVPFYVAAPASTFDLSCAEGADIPIEERPADEVTHAGGRRVAPEGVAVYNPAFDVTPARNVRAFFTDLGVIEPPYPATIPATLATADAGVSAAPPVDQLTTDN
ncbi:MAG: S-methyl-5-thioribose-1-phosphate isomerase, partial [Planctomycetes bacterium]|nr:S-methyl-5-thioribose-1-phosphate isomerase [Planctomycetota bacterium]